MQAPPISVLISNRLHSLEVQALPSSSKWTIRCLEKPSLQRTTLNKVTLTTLSTSSWKDTRTKTSPFLVELVAGLDLSQTVEVRKAISQLETPCRVESVLGYNTWKTQAEAKGSVHMLTRVKAIVWVKFRRSSRQTRPIIIPRKTTIRPLSTKRGLCREIMDIRPRNFSIQILMWLARMATSLQLGSASPTSTSAMKTASPN